MPQSSTAASHRAVDWMGFPCSFEYPRPLASVAKGACPASPTLSLLLEPHGESVAREVTEVWIWRDDHALQIRARCFTAAMERVRKLATVTTPNARDAWGDDALELQIDIGRTRREYLHLILPPNGIPVTYRGFNNRHEQGWHPAFDFRVTLEANAWLINVTLPFEVLGRNPSHGDVWGLNAMRVNANEPRHYVQWAPTFGDALRPELFGDLHFAALDTNRNAEVECYAKFGAERQAFFQNTINGLREPDALEQLGSADWTAWGNHLAHRGSPVSLRWDCSEPGVAGIPANERDRIRLDADAMVEQIMGWAEDPPAQAAFGLAPLEVLGDAWLLTGDQRYVQAFDRALLIHNRLIRNILSGVTDPHHLPYQTNPYHDLQVVNTAILAHAYLNLSRAGLSPLTHATMMWTVLRVGRFATFNIRAAYNYGNHQTYEAGGLGTLAALFPEFPESQAWADTASRAIRLHLEREVYPDGGYMERCGYHSVALSFAMHAVATVRLNHLEHRFPELMQSGTQATLSRMHEWLLLLNAPDGTFPAFGDCGASTYLVFLQRGASVYRLPELAWPLQQLAPDMVPTGLAAKQPTQLSVSLDSHFTVMRDGWCPESFYMAVDHGPLGGQHSHCDTMGFVAYAMGVPVALDSGIGLTYEDPRYVSWYRSLPAHNVVVIDGRESEKIAFRRSWTPGQERDVLRMRSLGYQHAMGVIHDRDIYFLKGIGWLIHDRITGPPQSRLGERQIDWMLHTPFPLRSVGPGRLIGETGGRGLAVLTDNDDDLQPARLEKMPSAVPCPEARAMRLWDASRRHAQDLTREITQLTLRKKPFAGDVCEFSVFLMPFHGSVNESYLKRDANGWTLDLPGGRTAQIIAADEAS